MAVEVVLDVKVKEQQAVKHLNTLEKQVDDLKSQLDLANEHIHDMKEAMHDLSDIRKQCD